MSVLTDPDFKRSIEKVTSSMYAVFLARSANLPKGYIFLPMFFFLFLMVNFLDPVAQNLIDRSSPKLQD